MRILSVGNLYPPHHFGGYELTWRSAVGYLREAGHEVRVLTTDYRRTGAVDGEEGPGVHRELRWYWHEHRFPRMGLRARLAIERHNAAVLERHLGELSPGVVNWWAMGGMSLSLVERVRREGCPAVGVVGDDWMVYGPQVDAWLKTFRGRPRIASAAERATGLPASVDLGAAADWLFNSERTRRASEAAGWRFRSTSVAHPGVDAALFREAPERPWTWRLLYVGRIDPRKGIELAVRALPLLPEEATLAVVGAGDDAHLAGLRRLADELGVGGRVRFEERERRRVPEAYAAADALVFPVLWEEPWGIVPLEAMAVGRPVVASARGGSAEYLQHERNCLIFDPGEGAGPLAAELERLARDGALRTRLREGGLATAARFTEEAYNRAIERAIERSSR